MPLRDRIELRLGKKEICIETTIRSVTGITRFDHGSSNGLIMPGKGQISRLEIEIEDNPQKIKFLEFNGCWPLESGDKIRAYISDYHGDKAEVKKIEKLRYGEVKVTYKNED